jgi:hypothetical protein
VTETISIAIVAAVGAYVGSAYAFPRGGRMKAPEASAQAYRDMIAALGELRSAYLDMKMAKMNEQPPTEAVILAVSRAGNGASGIAQSASFLFEAADLDLIDAAIATYSWPDFGERIGEVDKAINGLRKSANQLFRRK